MSRLRGGSFSSRIISARHNHSCAAADHFGERLACQRGQVPSAGDGVRPAVAPGADAVLCGGRGIRTASPADAVGGRGGGAAGRAAGGVSMDPKDRDQLPLDKEDAAASIVGVVGVVRGTIAR
jgi:hypothetical protein